MPQEYQFVQQYGTVEWQLTVCASSTAKDTRLPLAQASCTFAEKWSVAVLSTTQQMRRDPHPDIGLHVAIWVPQQSATTGCACEPAVTLRLSSSLGVCNDSGVV